MGKAFGDQQRPTVIRRKPLGMPAQEGGRAGTQIHRHIPDLTLHAGHQLHLGMGRTLEVHATHRTAAARIGVIDLGDGLQPAGSSQLLGTEQTGQETAAIAQALTLHALQPGQRQVGDGKAAHASASYACISDSHKARASRP
ncbi:hypothetical protein D3C78_1421660 [compost metagenome]